MAILTLRGIAEYASEKLNLDIWEYLELPTMPTGSPYIQWDEVENPNTHVKTYFYHGIPRSTYLLDKLTLIRRVYYLSMNFPALWQDPEALQDWIRNLSKTKGLKWQELYSSFFFEYNPIWNKDGSWDESHNITLDNTTQQPTDWKSSQTIKGKYKRGIRDYTQAYSDNLETVKIPGATTGESDTKWTPADATVEGFEYPDDGSYIQETTQSGTFTTRRTFSENTHHQEGGNIGVTQTTEMILAQRRMVEMYNMYDIMAWDIIKELCVMIYQ